jgi:hypothetical protein
MGERTNVTEPIAAMVGHFLKEDMSAPGAASLTSEFFSQRGASTLSIEK